VFTPLTTLTEASLLPHFLQNSTTKSSNSGLQKETKLEILKLKKRKEHLKGATQAAGRFL
jgi:hypothetical protein